MELGADLSLLGQKWQTKVFLIKYVQRSAFNISVYVSPVGQPQSKMGRMLNQHWSRLQIVELCPDWFLEFLGPLLTKKEYSNLSSAPQQIYLP